MAHSSKTSESSSSTKWTIPKEDHKLINNPAEKTEKLNSTFVCLKCSKL
jgi:hypothetical protein